MPMFKNCFCLTFKSPCTNQNGSKDVITVYLPSYLQNHTLIVHRTCVGQHITSYVPGLACPKRKQLDPPLSDSALLKSNDQSLLGTSYTHSDCTIPIYAQQTRLPPQISLSCKGCSCWKLWR